MIFVTLLQLDILIPAQLTKLMTELDRFPVGENQNDLKSSHHMLHMNQYNIFIQSKVHVLVSRSMWLWY